MSENIPEPTNKQWLSSQLLLVKKLGEWEYIRMTYWELGVLKIAEGTLLDDAANFQLRIHNSNGTSVFVPYPCLDQPYRIQVKNKGDQPDANT